jgi:hypothetical protein
MIDSSSGRPTISAVCTTFFNAGMGSMNEYLDQRGIDSLARGDVVHFGGEQDCLRFRLPFCHSVAAGAWL